MAEVAKLRPDCEIVLIGPDHDGSFARSGLVSLPNITWLGAKVYHQLPYYLGHFDVATIPFKVNELTQAVSPIKLFEYMAAGKPIISTDLNECRQHPEILIAGSAVDFAQLIDRALAQSQDAALRRTLEALAQENSWDSRAALLVEALGQRLASRR